jgi:hypothetical protein
MDFFGGENIIKQIATAGSLAMTKSILDRI